MKKIFVRLLISIISIALVFLTLELFAGFINPLLNLPHNHIDPGIGGKDVLEYPSGYIKDKDLFWRLDPSCEEYNSLGFRDKELSLRKDSDVFRIICMGDSVTFGWPTKVEDTYPKILEKLLNSHFPKKKFEVFNAGVPGYTSYQGLVWLKKDILRYSPDLIIVYYGINDAGYNSNNKIDREQTMPPEWIIKSANFLREFQFYRLVNKIILYVKYLLAAEKESYLVNRVPPENYKDNLESITKICSNNGIKTLFIVRPTWYDPENKIVFTNNRYIPPESIFQFDIYSNLDRREADSIFLDDCRPFNFHLTNKGHGILGEKIFKVFVNML